ncbi:MAG: hypothetical protein K1X29_05085 [Bdellovibrionales bacterium]|nr:hypothetical protein [Bdellovibrionales bacterium]
MRIFKKDGAYLAKSGPWIFIFVMALGKEPGFAATEKQKNSSQPTQAQEMDFSQDGTDDSSDTEELSVDEPMPLLRRKREPIELPNGDGSHFIQHPNAAQGLVKITKDKVYIYKTKVSDQKRASSLHLGFFQPTRLQNPETGRSMDEFYPHQNPMLLYDYEWQFFQRLGKMGFKLGTGLAMTYGSGQFENDFNGNLQPLEKFTFLVVPNSAGLIYRFQYWEKQFLVPYIEGGGIGLGFAELRDDGKRPKFGGALATYYVAGMAFKMNFLDPQSMILLDRDYSINAVYLFAEFRAALGFGRFDFSSQQINGGATVEF